MISGFCFLTCVAISSAFPPVTLKEVDIGLAADVGTLQRLPKVIGSRRSVDHQVTRSVSRISFHKRFLGKKNPPFVCSLVNELALTARKMYADEAKSSGLVR